MWLSGVVELSLWLSGVVSWLGVAWLGVWLGAWLGVWAGARVVGRAWLGVWLIVWCWACGRACVACVCLCIVERFAAWCDFFARVVLGER